MESSNLERLEDLFAEMRSEPGLETAALLRDEAAWAPIRESLEPWVAPDCRFTWIASFGRLEHTGLDGLRKGWLDWYEPWSSYRSRIEDMLELGDERLMVLVHERARAKDGTADVEMRPASICTFRDGKLVSTDFYASRDEALEVAGDQVRPR